MTHNIIGDIEQQLEELKATGLYKQERLLVEPQAARTGVRQGEGGNKAVINLCANNYLGLADNSKLIDAANQAMQDRGYGMASVRFICGTQDLHRQLEQQLAKFLGKEDAILYAACFDANGGLFEPLLDERDAVVSDALNHASIIDGIRLCKAKRYRYANADMQELAQCLQQAKEAGARRILIATDGVFSMDGVLAPLPEITALAQQYGALVIVDDCHSTGFFGPGGRGTPAHFAVENQVDILTGTLGKALGGALGGYVAGPQAIIDWLRQRSRPYLFSNSLPPAIVAAGLAALELVVEGDELRKTLQENTVYWREGLSRLGFDLVPGEHAIVPVMLGDAIVAQNMAAGLMEQGVYVTGFSYPVVPKGKARIRTQMNATLTRDDLDAALSAFAQVGRELEVI